MSDATSRLGLPYLLAAQSQKEVTHNEALDILDTIIFGSVISELSAPPGTPSAGDIYIVGTSATGAWLGKDKWITRYSGTVWQFISPFAGLEIWNEATGSKWRYAEGVWAEVAEGGGSGAAIGLGNYIAEGMSVVPGTGLQALINVGRGVISEGEVELTSQVSVSLLKRRAQMVYLKNNKSAGVVGCKYPAYNDANLVVRYDMNNLNGQWLPEEYWTLNATVEASGNYYIVTTPGVSAATEPTWPGSGTVTDGTVVWTKQAGAGTYVPNSASAGVANNLTPSGTVARVDGRKGFARKGDGSSGYFASANSTGFPTGTNTRELVYFFTCNSISEQKRLISTGHSNPYWYCLYQLNANLYVTVNSSDYDTGFAMEVGKQYLCNFQYDGTTIKLFVNGILIYTLTVSLGTIGQQLHVLTSGQLSSFSSHTAHFVEYRNAIRTPAQIATMAQEMLIPCVGAGSLTISPVLSSNSAPAPYAASADTEYGASQAAYKGSGSNSTFWATTVSAVPHWWKMDYGSIQSDIGSYSFVQNNTDLGWGSRATAWRLEGSNTGAFAGEESILDTRSGFDAASGISTTFYFTSKKAYRYFRLYITASSGDGSVAVRNFALQQVVQQTDIRTPNLPADSMVVGYAETGETAPTLIVDGSNPGGATPDWAYGIRVGPMGLLNRQKRLGWKYAALGANKDWDDVFGTRQVSNRYFGSIDALGTNMFPLSINTSGTYGCYENPSAAKVSRIYVGTNATAYINGAWIGACYINAIAEVLD